MCSEREMMAAFFTFVEPTSTALQDWFTTAQVGDECLIATQSKKPIMSLTKVGSLMVWWSLPNVGGQGNGFTLSIPFSDVLQTWAVAQAS